MIWPFGFIFRTLKSEFGSPSSQAILSIQSQFQSNTDTIMIGSCIERGGCFSRRLAQEGYLHSSLLEIYSYFDKYGNIVFLLI